jgi:hypothetical protein
MSRSARSPDTLDVERSQEGDPQADPSREDGGATGEVDRGAHRSWTQT